MDAFTDQDAASTGPSVDIFCRVIDNFGDIGVCWRLARSLHREWPAQVRLWVDNLQSFQRLAPSLKADKDQQQLDGIGIIHWTEHQPKVRPAQLVIEAFACDPPQEYVQAMPGHTRMWLNLEYLSAEPWVEGFHAQPSPQRNGLTKYFFFPGFSGNTGGLLHEDGLQEKRRRWLRVPGQKKRFFESLGLARSQDYLDANALFISLFCYPSAPYRSLLHALRKSSRPIVILVPETVLPQLERERAALFQDGDHAKDPPGGDTKPALPALTLLRIPFLPQETYDQLLWQCDLNFVRGEDSFIRAIWACKPFLWQIYEQSEDTHLKKLQAWLSLFPGNEPTKAMMRSWNSPSRHTYFSDQLSNMIAHPEELERWRRSCRAFAENLSKNKTLSASIQLFYEKAVESG